VHLVGPYYTDISRGRSTKHYIFCNKFFQVFPANEDIQKLL